MNIDIWVMTMKSNFKKLICTILVFLVASLSLHAQRLEQDTIKMQGVTISSDGKAEVINWIKISMNEAAQKAEREHKKILVYFTAKWCGPCHKMEQEVFTNYKVIREVNDNYIALKIDVDAWGGKKWQTDFGVRGMPEFFILDAKQRRVRRSLGAIPLAQFLAFLNLKETPAHAEMLDTSHVRLRAEKFKTRVSLGLGAGMSRLSNAASNTGFAYDIRLGYGWEMKRFGFIPAISFTSLGSSSVRYNYLRVPAQLALNFYRGSMFGLPGGWRATAGPYYGRLLNTPLSISNKNDVGIDYGLGIYMGDTADASLEFSLKGSHGFIDILPQPGNQNHQFFRAAITMSIRQW